MTEAKRLKAVAEYSRAQHDEKTAREGGDLRGIDQAKHAQRQAMDEIAAIDEATRTNAGKQRVILISPNPNANVTDANGLSFVDGKAEGVPLSLARKYTGDFDGYQIEGAE